jgi:hypothetical protein
MLLVGETPFTYHLVGVMVSDLGSESSGPGSSPGTDITTCQYTIMATRMGAQIANHYTNEMIGKRSFTN